VRKNTPTPKDIDDFIALIASGTNTNFAAISLGYSQPTMLKYMTSVQMEIYKKVQAVKAKRDLITRKKHWSRTKEGE